MIDDLYGAPLRTGIAQTAAALGISPIDLATAISYETGGTFDPLQPGPTTQWGQHRGLIQFGEPQAKQYGVDWNDPLNSQLGPQGAVANYLRGSGVKPGMGLLDVYSAINAGAPGRYGASDAGNGGAPGSVADKVAGMDAHRQKALALFGGEAPATPGFNPNVAGLEDLFIPPNKAAPQRAARGDKAAADKARRVALFDAVPGLG